MELYLDLGKIYRDLRKERRDITLWKPTFRPKGWEGHPYQGRVLLFQASIYQYARFEEARRPSFAFKRFNKSWSTASYYARAFTIVVHLPQKLHEAFVYTKKLKNSRELLGEPTRIGTDHRRMGLPKVVWLIFRNHWPWSRLRALMTRIFGSEHHLIGGLSKSLGVYHIMSMLKLNLTTIGCGCDPGS